MIENESETFWDPDYDVPSEYCKDLSYVTLSEMGAVGAFGPDFHLKGGLAAELRIDNRWQKRKQ